MKNAVVVIICMFFTLSSCTLRCNPHDNCLCLPGTQEFEFQCPSDFADFAEFVIHIQEENEILIDCTSDLENFNIYHLPNITLHKIKKFRIRFCPLPIYGFKDVFTHFSMEEIKYFQYGSFNLTNKILKKEYFRGLEGLDYLQLNADGLIHLEEDVFLYTPNLTRIDLQLNHIILKKDLFQYTPYLKQLDISENKLEEIPNELFKNLNKLELLHLWSNNLKTLNDSTFQGLISLKSLELSSNQIENISEGAFKTLWNLTKINLTSNKLKTLVANIFSHNSKLQWIKIKNNQNLKLSEYIFSNLPELQEIDLTNCKIEDLPENIFTNSPKLQIINLSSNNLKVLPKKIFVGLKNLQEINLAGNKIETIGSIFDSLNGLKILDLQRNFIKEITEKDFKNLYKLEKIDLSRNEINKIDNFALNNNENLKEINLSFNNYSGDHDSHLVLLENVPNIERINLKSNRIVEISHVISLYNKVHLEFLDLSNNIIANIIIKDLQPLSSKLTINLENNNITFVNFAFVDIIISQDRQDIFSGNNQPQSTIFLGNNPLNCDCYNNDLVKYYQYDLQPQIRAMFDIKSENVKCASPPELKDLSLEDVPQMLLVCEFNQIEENNSCPDKCSCFWRPFDDSLVLDCTNRSLRFIPDISQSQMVQVRFNQTEVHLEGNELLTGPNGSLSGYENVTKLFLSDNFIKNIDWIPPKIEVLHLDHNNIRFFKYKILDMLNVSTMRNLTLDNNPWSCDCDAANFTNFLRQKTKVIDAKLIICQNGSQLLINLNKRDLCHEFEMAGITIAILLFLLLVACFVVMYYRYQQAIKVWLYAHNLCLCWVTEDELDKDKIYDAFISYSHKDEEFVVENLLPVLESGPNPYKLCLHFRNFVPGEFISTQITNSVIDSRRTLVVLSKNFLQSVWGKMEFRTAHTQAMTEGRARVIIVLYGDIEIEQLDEELKSYLKTNTYVKWGDPYFSNKLRYALPHSKKNTSQNKQKIANVMNCIDDKFTLMAPVVSSPGTTPPVLNLDPNILKKHPLNFVPNSGIDTPPAESGILLTSTCL